MKRVLILGASGFIGQNLAKTMMLHGYHVIGYGRSLNKDMPWVKGDFGQEDRFEDILRENEVDCVVHLISTTVPHEGTEQIPKELEENVVPTIKLLEAMKNVGTRELLFVSSGGTVYGESLGRPSRPSDPLQPICTYGVQKMIIEKYLQLYAALYGIRVKIVRLSNPYGVPPQKPRGQGIIPIFIERLLKNEPIVLYGNTVRDYIHIDDAVNGIIKFIEYPGTKTVLNFGSGQGIKIEDIVNEIEKLADKKFISVTRMPIRTCDVENNVLDIQETADELDWSAGIDLETGIRRTIEELKSAVDEQRSGTLISELHSRKE